MNTVRKLDNTKCMRKQSLYHDQGMWVEEEQGRTLVCTAMPMLVGPQEYWQETVGRKSCTWHFRFAVTSYCYSFITHTDTHLQTLTGWLKSNLHQPALKLGYWTTKNKILFLFSFPNWMGLITAYQVCTLRCYVLFNKSIYLV